MSEVSNDRMHKTPPWLRLSRNSVATNVGHFRGCDPEVEIWIERTYGIARKQTKDHSRESEDGLGMEGVNHAMGCIAGTH